MIRALYEYGVALRVRHVHDWVFRGMETRIVLLGVAGLLFVG